MPADKDWPIDVVDYATTVTRTIQGPMQAYLRWELLKGQPRYRLLAAEWFDKGSGIETEEITLRNMGDLVKAVREVGNELGPALFVSRNRGIRVSKAVYDKAKTDAAAEHAFRLADEWRR